MAGEQVRRDRADDHAEQDDDADDGEDAAAPRATAALALANRLLHVAPVQILRAIRAPAVSTAVMVGAIVSAELLMPLVLHAGEVVTLCACLPLAASAYAGTLMVIDLRLLTEARSVFLRGL